MIWQWVRPRNAITPINRPTGEAWKKELDQSMRLPFHTSLQSIQLKLTPVSISMNMLAKSVQQKLQQTKTETTNCYPLSVVLRVPDRSVSQVWRTILGPFMEHYIFILSRNCLYLSKAFSPLSMGVFVLFSWPTCYPATRDKSETSKFGGKATVNP